MPTTEMHDVEAEQRLVFAVAEEGRVLGARKAAALFASLKLMERDFFDERTRKALNVIVECISRQLAPIQQVIAPQLGLTNGEWGDYAPCFERSEILSVPQAQALSYRVRELASRRRAYDEARKILALAQEGKANGFELSAEMARAAGRIPGASGVWRDDLFTLDANAIEVRATQEARVGSSTVETGYHTLDELTGGFQATLCVVCGFPGQAKSGFVGSVIRNMMRRGDRAALFSMEDRATWLTYRWLSHESGVPNFVLRYKQLSGEQWGSYGIADSAIRKWPGRAFFDDRAGLKPQEVLFAAREAFEDLKVSAVFLDNMTAMRMPRGDRRDLEFQDFLVEARALADEFRKPFVVVSHTKFGEGRKSTDMPRLIDCSESTAFDKLARCAYGISKGEGSIKIGVLKNNSGVAGSVVSLPFRGRSALLEDP